MSWNYRVCTHLFSYKEAFVNNPKMAENKDVRIFAIHSVYYDKEGIPNGTSKNPESVGGYESFEVLVSTMDLMKKALSKPILDLDDFPNEWDDGDPYDLSVHSPGSDFYKDDDEPDNIIEDEDS